MDYSPKPKRNKLKKTTPDKTRGKSELAWYVYWRGFFDIDFFIKYHFSHFLRDKKTQKEVKSPEFHKELKQLLQNDNDVLVCISRGHAKSTISFFVMMHDICYKKEKAILLIMSEWLGVETIWKIRDEFEASESLQSIFWRLVPNRTQDEANKKRTKKWLDFLNGVTIETVSTGWSIRWKRPTKIVIDDPQENKDVINEQITDKFNNRFFTTIYPALTDSWVCKIIWTNVWELCFVNFLLQNDRGFDIIEYTAVIDGEFEEKEDRNWVMRKHLVGWKTLRPDYWGIEALNNKLQTMGRNERQQEYMNVPFILNWSPVFDLELVKNIVSLKPIEQSVLFPWLWMYKDPCECSWGIDLSMWWPNGDFTTIVARDYEYNLVFVYQARVLRYTLMNVIDHLDWLWYFGVKVFERNTGTAQSIFDMAQDRAWYSDIYRWKSIWQITEKETLNLWWTTTMQSKQKSVSRMQAVVNGYTDDDWLYHKLTQYDEREKREMLQFYVDKNWRANALPPHHDDLIDADWLCLQGLKEWLWLDLDF